MPQSPKNTTKNTTKKTKVLHTSDWHLGKKLFKRERHQEQQLFLSSLKNKIRDEKITILIIAGDIFDSPIPPTKSLSLFFEFLGALDQEANSLEHVFAIGGNHDNGALLESPRPFLNPDFFKIVGTMEHEDFASYGLITGEGILICALPFFRPRDLFSLEIEIPKPFDSLQEELLFRLEWWLKKLRAHFCKEGQNPPSILVGHHLFGSYHLSGSELGVALSGLETLPLKYFTEWDILALGHIHKPQCIKKEGPAAYYCGSPYPLRFSESNHKKMLLYERSEESDEWHISWQDIPLIRPLLRIKGHSKDVLEKALALATDLQGQLPPFVELTLTDGQLAPSLSEELRSLFLANELEVINLYSLDSARLESTLEESGPINNLSTAELFKLFLDEYEINDDQKRELITHFGELQQIVSDENALP